MIDFENTGETDAPETSSLASKIDIVREATDKIPPPESTEPPQSEPFFSKEEWDKIIEDTSSKLSKERNDLSQAEEVLKNPGFRRALELVWESVKTIDRVKDRAVGHPSSNLEAYTEKQATQGPEPISGLDQEKNPLLIRPIIPVQE